MRSDQLESLRRYMSFFLYGMSKKSISFSYNILIYVCVAIIYLYMYALLSNFDCSVLSKGFSVL